MKENFYVVWTKVKWEIEADPRDFKVETVLPTPTNEQIEMLPSSFSWRKNIAKTSYQNWRWSCTALWWTHNMQILNIKELSESIPERKKEIFDKISNGDNILNLSREDLWTKMGHVLWDKWDSWDYVENMIKSLYTKWILWYTIDGKQKNYLADWFAYFNMNSTLENLQQLKFQITQSPLVFVIKWNSTIRSEMMQWEINTIIDWSERNWAHCIALDWFNKIWLQFLNSRKPNGWNSKICSFTISYEKYIKMYKAWMINWRCWRIFDKKDTVVDLEFEKRKQEAMQTVRQLKKSYEKWTIEDRAFIGRSWIWDYLRRIYWFTDNDL